MAITTFAFGKTEDNHSLTSKLLAIKIQVMAVLQMLANPFYA
jgi:hypothetical protein